jgi:hypothetical protein
MYDLTLSGTIVLKGVTRFFASSNFSKIRRDISKPRWWCTGINDTGGKLAPVSTTPAENFATGSAGVIDTGVSEPRVENLVALSL